MLRNIIIASLLTVAQTAAAQSRVFYVKEISPQSLLRLYKAVGRKAEGRVAVKISTGEAGGHHYLQPQLIAPLVDEVNGTIVECNTAYPGSRNTSEAHWQTIHRHGFDSIAAVDIMDEQGDIRIPVRDKRHIKYNIVGSHLPYYDFMINLAHFKGHAMGGFGGVLKNASIGVASSAGKAYIHTAGYTADVDSMWQHVERQDAFLEAMAAAAQSVHEYFGNGTRIIYINVMNNLSVDCDCDSSPEAPQLRDMGIMASTDPVALDQACLDMVFRHKDTEGNTAQPLIQRIREKHGTHTVDYAERIGLGSKKYIVTEIE